MASRGGREGSLHINQDVNFYASVLDAGKSLQFPVSSGRYAWLQVTSGELDVNGVSLKAGDGAAVRDEKELSLKAPKKVEFLLFDLN